MHNTNVARSKLSRPPVGGRARHNPPAKSQWHICISKFGSNNETCSNCNRPPIHPHRKRTFSTVPKKSWRISPRVRFPPFRVASSTSAIMWARAAATGHRAAASTSASLRHRSGLMGSPSAAARANNFAWMCTDVIERIGERGKAL